jgi:hypothetical protein
VNGEVVIWWEYLDGWQEQPCEFLSYYHLGYLNWCRGFASCSHGVQL